MSRNTRSTVTAIGDSDLVGLQGVCPLGPAGLRVELASAATQAITRRSKYVAACHRVEHRLVKPSRFHERIVKLLRNYLCEPVAPDTDMALAALTWSAMDVSHTHADRSDGPIRAAFDPTGDTSESSDPFRENRETFRSVYSRIIRCIDKLAADVRRTGSWPVSLRPIQRTVGMIAC